MSEQVMPAIKIFFLLTFVTGVAYPLAITALGQIAFTRQVNGSLIEKNGNLVGSSLIAQKFENPKHFWARPSAVDYNPNPSGGSNLGPTSADLKTKIEDRKKAGMTDDLLFASASGLDPHISPASAHRQVDRIVNSLGIKTEEKETFANKLHALVNEKTEKRQWLLLGETRVNVLMLNLELDEMVMQ